MTITLFDGSKIILRNQIWLNEFLIQLDTAISNHTVRLSFADTRTEQPTVITVTRGEDFASLLDYVTSFEVWSVSLV